MARFVKVIARAAGRGALSRPHYDPAKNPKLLADKVQQQATAPGAATLTGSPAMPATAVSPGAKTLLGQ
jgi:hypothetical protein